MGAATIQQEYEKHRAHKYGGPTNTSKQIIVFILIEGHQLFGRIRNYSPELSQERKFK